MVIYEFAFRGNVHTKGKHPIARVYDSLDNRNPGKPFHFYSGENSEDFLGLAKKIVDEEGEFDSNVSGTFVTTIPAPLIVSGDFDSPGSLEDITRFFKALNRASEIKFAN